MLLWAVQWRVIACVRNMMTLLQSSMKRLIDKPIVQQTNNKFCKKSTGVHAGKSHFNILHVQYSDAKGKERFNALTVEHAFKLSTNPLSAHLLGECFPHLEHKDNSSELQAKATFVVQQSRHNTLHARATATCHSLSNAMG